ncbi:MAG: type II secretion system protein GspD [Chlamydiales bacterium]|nr:type II secretion system protein GspD [Chlamydiales bacterium]
MKYNGTLTLFCSFLLSAPVVADSIDQTVDSLFPSDLLVEEEISPCEFEEFNVIESEEIARRANARMRCRYKGPGDGFYYQVPHVDVKSGIEIDLSDHPSNARAKQKHFQPPPTKSSTENTRAYVLPHPTTPVQDQVKRAKTYEFKQEKPVHYNMPDCTPSHEGYTVNFENIEVVELLHFVSKISGVNFIYEKEHLNFSVTMVSQEAASPEDLTSALLQILKMHGLSVVEQGGTVLIYDNQSLSKVSRVITDANVDEACDSAVITRVFRLYNVDAKKISSIVKPLLSRDAIVEVSEQTRHLIVSDITANVDKIADLLNALDTPNAAFEIAEYHVKSAYPSALVAYSKEILAPLIEDNPMQMIAQPSMQKIFIVSTPYLINKALQILESLDAADITDVADLPASSMANNNIFMYKLRYHDGKEISDALHEIGINLQYAGVTNLELVNTVYSVQWIEANNSIVVTGTQDAVEKVVMLLEDLDQPPKQVYLEVLILDVTLKDSLDFGVQWIALGDEQNKLAYASGLLGDSTATTTYSTNIDGTTSTNPGARFVAGNPAGSPPTTPRSARDVPLPVPSNLTGILDSSAAEAFGFGIIGNILKHKGRSFLTLGALVSALEEESSVNLVLNPRIMAQDTQTASFFVGTNIPYQTTSTVVGVTGATTQNVQYEDVGVQLKVTPTIAPNNIVSLQIDQTVADVTSAQGVLNPTTDKTLATTRVHVPDGCFLVMSGHIRDRVVHSRSGIPCLGSLPLIGPTFSRTIDQREKRNLVMFVRPHVVSNIQESLDLTNREGYNHNWNTDPCSLTVEPEQGPECEKYPPKVCTPDCSPRRRR